MTAQLEARGSAKAPPPREAQQAEPAARGCEKRRASDRRFDPRMPALGERAGMRRMRRLPGEEDPPRGVSPGPLGHQSHAPLQPATQGGAVDAIKSVAGVADRILAGVNGRGEATAVIELGGGDWAGTQVNLVAGAKGLEVTVYAATEAARRVVQVKLASLARALAERGIAPTKIEVSVRDRDNRRGSRQDGRR